MRKLSLRSLAADLADLARLPSSREGVTTECAGAVDCGSEKGAGSHHGSAGSDLAGDEVAAGQGGEEIGDSEGGQGEEGEGVRDPL